MITTSQPTCSLTWTCSTAEPSQCIYTCGDLLRMRSRTRSRPWKGSALSPNAKKMHTWDRFWECPRVNNAHDTLPEWMSDYQKYCAPQMWRNYCRMSETRTNTFFTEVGFSSAYNRTCRGGGFIAFHELMSPWMDSFIRKNTELSNWGKTLIEQD